MNKKREYLGGYLLLAPAVLLSLVIFVLPFFVTVGLSFFDVNFLNASRGFMGLQHYINFFSSPRNQKILLYSLIFLVVCLPATVVGAFIAASLLNKSFKGQGFFRTMNILPWVVAGVCSAFMFRWVFNESNVGLVNQILKALGFSQVFWMSDSKMNFVVIMLCVIWKAIPLPLILMLNGMQSVPEEYYEVVDIEGGGWWAKLRYVTLPLIMGQVRIIFVSTTIGLLGGIDVMRTIGGSGDFRVIGYTMYAEAFYNFNLSSASAVGVIMMLIDIILAVVYIKLFKLNGGD